MNSASERTRSLWQVTAPDLSAPKLVEDRQADVIVVGAGIAGLSVAYELAREGCAVVVLDRGAIGGGMTGRTTAHLSNELDDRYADLVRLRGMDDARIAAAALTASTDRIDEIRRAEGIDCDFRRIDGYLFLAPGDDPRILADELVATHEVGLTAVERVPRAPLPFDTGPCLRFPAQARFHPLAYLAGLVGGVRRHGGAVFADSPVVSFAGGADATVVTQSGRRVRGRAIVVATNSPVNDRVAMHSKQAPYRTYALALRVPAGRIADALYWDTADPYHYVRLQASEREGEQLLIVGGEDHKSGQAQDGAERLRRLEAWARERFADLGEVAHAWSGQVMEPVDDLAFIGRNPADSDNVFIVTGDSGMGMNHGVIAGRLIADLFLGRDNPWARLYDPARATITAVREYARENLNVAAQLRAYVTGGELGEAAALAPGTGAVMREGLRKVAVYRDLQGKLHKRSAVCPHLGCIVAWNPLEGCWDCPCHGSHYAADGSVLNGPARRGLDRLD